MTLGDVVVAAVGSGDTTGSGGATGSGSTSGFLSIAIGIAIIVATVRWTVVHRRNNKGPTDATPAPPVRRLGADTQWWRENSGTSSPGPEEETRS